MDEGSRISWLFTVGLLILAAMLFAVTETAFSSVSHSRIKMLAEKGNSSAKKAEYVLDHFESAITTMLICTNIIHIAAASIVTVNVTKIWGVSAVTVSTLVTTLVVFFFGEMLPKSIARKYSERFSLATAGTLRFFMILFGPASSLLTFIGNAAAKLTKGDSDVSVTEGELYDIIEDMTREGSLDENQGDLISSALQFQDVTVEGILTSRIDLTAIDVDSSVEEVLRVIKTCNHSRLPVYEGTIDHIIGILQIRKYVKAYLGKEDVSNIRPFLDEPYFIHQSAKIDDVLSVMSTRKMNMSVVLDNYGGTLGVVTVEDILEELVGEIWDEDDSVEENMIQITDNLYSVKANQLVIDVLDDLEVHYDEAEEERIANKLMSELTFEAFPNIPKEGDSFHYLDLEITVQIMKQNRIIRLKVRKEARE